MQGVDARYGKGDKVLDDVSIDLPRGGPWRWSAIRVWQINRGPCDHRPVAPEAGQITFKGQACRRLKQRSRTQLQQIQMIYQMADTALNPRHKVREIIGRPLILSGADRFCPGSAYF